MEQHLPVWREFPVKCPNKCKIEGLMRKQLNAHIDECLLQVIECPFSSAGCNTAKLPHTVLISYLALVPYCWRCDSPAVHPALLLCSTAL